MGRRLTVSGRLVGPVGGCSVAVVLVGRALLPERPAVLVVQLFCSAAAAPAGLAGGPGGRRWSARAAVAARAGTVAPAGSAGPAAWVSVPPEPRVAPAGPAGRPGRAGRPALAGSSAAGTRAVRATPGPEAPA